MTELPRTEWVRYTPSRAAHLLEANPRNRKLRSTVVDRYAADMINGDWLLNGETIKVAADGTLLDGQHRLAAVVQAGLDHPVMILTVHGLDPAVQNVTDTGLKRTPADVLHLAGIKNSSQLSSAIRCIVRLESGRIFNGKGSSQMVTNSEMLHWLQDNPEVMGFMDRRAWALRKTNIPPSPAAAAVWLLHNLDMYRAAEFVDGLVSLEGLPKGSPVAALSRHVNSLRINRSRLEPVEWIGMVFEAWNAWVSDQPAPSFRSVRYTQANFPWPISHDEALRRAEQAAEQAARQARTTTRRNGLEAV